LPPKTTLVLNCWRTTWAARRSIASTMSASLSTYRASRSDEEQKTRSVEEQKTRSVEEQKIRSVEEQNTYTGIDVLSTLAAPAPLVPSPSTSPRRTSQTLASLPILPALHLFSCASRQYLVAPEVPTLSEMFADSQSRCKNTSPASHALYHADIARYTDEGNWDMVGNDIPVGISLYSMVWQH